MSILLSETSRPILGAFGNDTRIAPNPGGSSVSGVSTTRTTPSNRKFLIVTGIVTPIFEVTLTFAFISLDQSTSMSRAMASSRLYVRADANFGPLAPKSNSTKVILRTFEFLRSARALTKFSFAIEESNFGVRESTKYCKEISPGVPITALYIDASSLMACTPSTAAFLVRVSCSLRTCHASRHFHCFFRSSPSSIERRVSRATCRPYVKTLQTLEDTALNIFHPRSMFSFPMAKNVVTIDNTVEKKIPPRMKATNSWNTCVMPENLDDAAAALIDADIGRCAAAGNMCNVAVLVRW
mmetsp:Transcript_28826/g.49057  ORF Transcript_28826/g.49057 Transcript_28826/m.49057 type:complete len:297 (-) Transcript_28826:39-929(-)